MTQVSSESLRIRGGRPLCGEVRLGHDTPIVESTLAIAALAHGRSELHGLSASPQLDVAVAAWSALGARCTRAGDGLLVEGAGLDSLTAPRGAIECGYSLQLLAQLAGVLSGQRFGTRVLASACEGSAVENWAPVLRARGAQLAARGGEGERLSPPIAIAPLLDGERLHGLDAGLTFADAAGKAAILMSGLYAEAATLLSEPQVSSDHLERAFVAAGVPLRRIGSVVSLDVLAWDRRIAGLGRVQMPASACAAAYFAAVVQALPGSDVTLRSVSVNPTQSGVLDMLRSWGAPLTLESTGDAALREPVADLRVRAAALRGGVVDAEVLLRAGDGLPALALLGALSLRGVHMYDLGALGARADAQWTALDPVFAAFGIELTRAPGELRVAPTQWSSAPTRRQLDVRSDPALAIAACALALACPGETVVEHAAGALAAVYPDFVDAAQRLGASIESV